MKLDLKIGVKTTSCLSVRHQRQLKRVADSLAVNTAYTARFQALIVSTGRHRNITILLTRVLFALIFCKVVVWYFGCYKSILHVNKNKNK